MQTIYDTVVDTNVKMKKKRLLLKNECNIVAPIYILKFKKKMVKVLE